MGNSCTKNQLTDLSINFNFGYPYDQGSITSCGVCAFNTVFYYNLQKKLKESL